MTVASVTKKTPIFILINTNKKNMCSINQQIGISSNIIAISENKNKYCRGKEFQFVHKRP